MDVIDVLQLQREKSKKSPPIIYSEKTDHFFGIRFIFECGKWRRTADLSTGINKTI